LFFVQAEGVQTRSLIFKLTFKFKNKLLSSSYKFFY